MRAWSQKGPNPGDRYDAQVLDVEMALTVAGQQEGTLDDDLPPVVDRDCVPLPRDRARQDVSEPKRSAKAPSTYRPTWAITPVPPGSTATRRVLLASTVEVHFCCGNLCLRTPSLSPTARAFPLPRAAQLNRPRGELGLAEVQCCV